MNRNRVVYLVAHHYNHQAFKYVEDLYFSKKWKELSEYINSKQYKVFKLEGHYYNNSKEFNKDVNDYYYKLRIVTTREI